MVIIAELIIFDALSFGKLFDGSYILLGHLIILLSPLFDHFELVFGHLYNVIVQEIIFRSKIARVHKVVAIGVLFIYWDSFFDFFKLSMVSMSSQLQLRNIIIIPCY